MNHVLDSVFTRLLRSRRLLLLTAALFVAIVTLLVPEFAPLRDELFTITAVLILVFISGLDTQSAVGIARDAIPTYADHDLRDLLREVILEVLDEVLNTDE